MSSSPTDDERSPLDVIAAKIPGLDCWQPRDWPHRVGDELQLSLLSMPLTADSPGVRSHPCEQCGRGAQTIHDNVLCWKCKGAFCLWCGGGNPAHICAMSVDALIQNGFGRCPACDEPLRSMALVDVFRPILECQSASGTGESNVNFAGDMPFVEFRGENNPRLSSRTGIMDPGGSSLVQEAEDALERAREHQANGRRDEAILAYTHAINAINYLTSSSGGMQLVLRAHDIFLMAHGYRAELEGNSDLTQAIRKAYPKASVKAKPPEGAKTAETWRLSKSAFEALFYPLPANVMAGAHGNRGGFATFDLRTETRERAINSPGLRKQVELIGGSIQTFQSFMGTMPHCEGVDPLFARLDGTWRGIYMHEAFQTEPFTTIVTGRDEVKIMHMIQFVRVFPTAYQAKEYTRVTIQEGKIGEEGVPLNAQHSAELTKRLKTAATKDLNVNDLHKVHVLKAQIPGPMRTARCISAVAAVENVSTKVFVPHLGEANAAIPLIARALAYLEQQLLKYRSSASSSASFSTKQKSIHHPDLSICAYCGKSGADNKNKQQLKRCGRCKLSLYCSITCQKKHWEMPDPFGHKKLCKEAVRAANSGGSGA